MSGPRVARATPLRVTMWTMLLIPVVSQNLLFTLFAALIVLVLGGNLLYQQSVDRRRTRDYTEHCLARGLHFEHDRPGEEARHTATCRLFDAGHSRKWGYTITGERGDIRYTIFEYRWTTGAGKSAQVHTIGAVLWPTTRDLPQFMLTPEGFVAKIAAWFGGQDIDFDDSPQFSDLYRLQGSNEAAVRALFAADLRHALERDSKQHVAGAGKELIWWRDGGLPPTEALDQFLMEGERIRQLFDRPA